MVVVGDLKQSLLKGAISSAISVVLARFALEAYIVLTISIGDGNLISRMVNAALVLIAVTTFLSGFLSSYLEIEN